MLEPLFGKASERKMRLFSCACVRRVWHLLWSESSRRAVEVSERYADRTTNHNEMVEAYRRAWDAWEEGELWAGADMSQAAEAVTEAAWTLRANRAVCEEEGLYFNKSRGLRDAVLCCLENVVGARAWEVAIARGESHTDAAVHREERANLRTLVGCVFGNPFRPTLAWQTPAVQDLAQAASDNRILPAGTLDPERLAILADALEESGCTEADILTHLRGPGPHVRGCFAVDLILNKS
jgi:hypothetical protein